MKYFLFVFKNYQKGIPNVNKAIMACNTTDITKNHQK